MTWLIVAVVVVCAAFSGTFIYTGDIWTAAFAGGIPALLYMTGLAIQAAWTPASRGRRIAVVIVAIVALSGISAQFTVMCSRTRWQCSQLMTIRRSIDRGILMSTLFDRASATFVTYQQQHPNKKRTLAEVFTSSWNGRDWRADQVFLESAPESLKVYACIGSRGDVVLTGVSILTRGADPNFHNVNGKTGFVQSRLHLTAEGMDYENEN